VTGRPPGWGRHPAGPGPAGGDGAGTGRRDAPGQRARAGGSRSGTTRGPGDRPRQRSAESRRVESRRAGRRHRGLGRSGRLRSFGLLVIVAIAFTAIGIRLVVIQGVDSGHYLAAGGSEWEQAVSLPAERGNILDRNGNELAMSVPQTTIYADPHQVNDPDREAVALGPVLSLPVATVHSLLTEHSGFVYLARTVDDATAARVAKLDLAGIYSLKEPKRFYPAGQLAQSLLGTVGTDGGGLGGLEYRYNSMLAGQAGKSIEQIDPYGHQIPGGVQEYQAPVPGQDLVLSIDEPLQYDAEQALAQAIVAAGAKDGIALLMNSKTGEILADAQLAMPTAGSTQPPAVPVRLAAPAGSAGGSSSTAQPVEASSATSFTHVYEPGSVNKLITISAALDTGVITPSEVFTIPDSYQVAGTTFHDAETHPTEHWTVTDVLANSSNIGTIQIAQRLGRANLLKFIQAYGLGAATDVGFPGESDGLLPTYWSGTSIADVPIGQGIAVTAMQMLAAYNSIANGGIYVPPKLVDATIDAQGHEHLLPAATPHRVVTATVAKEMTTMLDEVVRVGTGTAANLDPYTVAGKTGTALVPSPSGGYEAGHYVASFAGFVPSEDPQITGMVVIDDTPDYGAAASAPTFATIARDALHTFNIQPLPVQPPAPGVPLATSESATGAGEVAGTPLPGLTGSVAPTAASVAAPPQRPASPGPTTPAAAGAGAPTTVAAPRSRSSPAGG
jgi:cell division protein FtsI (penicillin-binding protein 3)